MPFINIMGACNDILMLFSMCESSFLVVLQKTFVTCKNNKSYHNAVDFIINYIDHQNKRL